MCKMPLLGHFHLNICMSAFGRKLPVGKQMFPDGSKDGDGKIGGPVYNPRCGIDRRVASITSKKPSAWRRWLADRRRQLDARGAAGAGVDHRATAGSPAPATGQRPGVLPPTIPACLAYSSRVPNPSKISATFHCACVTSMVPI